MCSETFVTTGSRSRHRLHGPERPAAQSTSEAPRLVPTTHTPLPAQPSLFWLVPDEAARTAAARENSPTARFARGVKLIADGQHTAGLPLVRGADLQTMPLAAYAQYYTGVALAGLGRLDEAQAVLTALDKRDPAGYLEEAVPMQLADIAMSARDTKAALEQLEDLSDEKLSAPEEIFLRLGRAAEAAGNREKALTAYRRVYYEFPLSGQASEAQSGMERLEAASLVPPDRFKRELARAERLFSARRWAQARAAFAPLARAASGDDRELIALRLAESDYYLDRHRASRDALRPFLKGGSREAEARFFHLTATRALGDHATYVALARELVKDQPDTEWAEEALNNLATHYVMIDDDEEADRVFRELHPPVPEEPLRRARGVEGWLVVVSGRRLRGGRRSVRVAPPRTSRAPTTGRRGCTGLPARAIRWASRRRPPLATASSSPTTRTPITDARRRSASMPAASRRCSARSPADRAVDFGLDRPSDRLR